MTGLEDRISKAIDQSSTLDEFYEWLLLQKDVESVIVEDGIVKTFPPQKELRVVFKRIHSNFEKIVDIYVYPNGSISFAGLHDR